MSSAIYEIVGRLYGIDQTLHQIVGAVMANYSIVEVQLWRKLNRRIRRVFDKRLELEGDTLPEDRWPVQKRSTGVMWSQRRVPVRLWRLTDDMSGLPNGPIPDRADPLLFKYIHPNRG